MSNVLIEEQHLNDIADAIRGKNGSSQAYYPSEMAQAIEDIESGGKISYRLPYGSPGMKMSTILNITFVKSVYDEGCVVLFTAPDGESRYQLIESEGTTQIEVRTGSYVLVGEFITSDREMTPTFSCTTSDGSDSTYITYINGDSVHISLFWELPRIVYRSLFYYMIGIGNIDSLGKHNITVYGNSAPCFIKGTKITLADGSTKNCEDITFDDELLVWNFYEGKFDVSKPILILKPHVAPNYNLVEFSDGTKIGFVGNTEYHRIYNNECHKFTGTNSDETPIGTTTFKDDGSTPKIISKKIISKNVEYYNIITEKHYNCFVNGVLSSCQLSNEYSIKDMRYYGDKLISDKEKEEYIKSKIDNEYLWKHN